MRQCAELADLAMQLARAAAARTLADWAEPEQPPPAEPPVTQAAEPPATNPAEPRPDRQTAPRPNPARTTSPKQTDPAVLFTRFAAIVRDCIALEARLAGGPANAPNTSARNTREPGLAAGPANAPNTSAPLTRRADRRLTLLRDALFAAAENHPDQAVIRYEIITRLDERLAANPNHTIDGGDLLEEICDELGLKIDWDTVPNELLFHDSDKANLHPDAPDPHATSPP